MENGNVAACLIRIADALEIKGESGFKVMAYRRAARVLEDLTEDIAVVAADGRLQDIAGIGKGISQKIEEYLSTGTMRKLLEATVGVPKDLFELLGIQNLGARTIHIIYRELGIRSREELKLALEDGRVAALKGLGPKTADNIRQGLELFERAGSRIPIELAARLAEDLITWIRNGPYPVRISPAGSLRRMRESVGDIDILASGHDGSKIIEHFTHHPRVTRILAQGGTKGSVMIAASDREYQADLRIVPEESWGSAQQYFTGSREHNIRLRSLAREMGLKISEYGVYRGDKRIAGKTEEQCYRALGLDWIPPEMREDRGEVELAGRNELPPLVELAGILGDLHVHSTFSDGTLSLAELAAAAEELGYRYLAVCDHSRSVSYAGGLSPERLLEQQREIDHLNTKLHGLTLLKGAEVDILADGSLDYPDRILSGLDVVMASIHSGFRRNVTERMLKAIRNPHVTAISHPTGRLISGREGYLVDLEAVMTEAARHGVALEMNADADRLDLGEHDLRLARSKGVLISLGTDTHHAEGLKMMRFGVGIARRAWLPPESVLNTRTAAELAGMRKRRRA